MIFFRKRSLINIFRSFSTRECHVLFIIFLNACVYKGVTYSKTLISYICYGLYLGVGELEVFKSYCLYAQAN